jgi:copper chaperone
MSSVVVTVAGMTCGHCASSVREELGSIAGVTAVVIDLASGMVTIDSEQQVEPEAIKGAIEEAGYELAS